MKKLKSIKKMEKFKVINMFALKGGTGSDGGNSVASESEGTGYNAN